MNYSVYSTETVKLVDHPDPKQILKLKTKTFAKLKNKEIRIKHKYIGLNFYDIDTSRSVIKKPDGFVPGIEALGEIVEVGSNSSFNIGDLVCYCTHHFGGGYGEYNVIDENFAILVPANIDPQNASAITMRGIFSHTLLKRVFIVDHTCYVLIFNPSGGLGHIICQFAKHYGAVVIGVTSKKETQTYDEQMLKKHGCDLVINYDDPDFEKNIMVLTAGKGVNVVYDTIGGNNLLKSIPVMQYCGLYVSLGQNSGMNLKISMQRAMEKSIFITRPSFFEYKHSVNDLRSSAVEVYELFNRNVIQPQINKLYGFEELKAAHFYMVNRKVSFINLIKLT